MTLMGLADSSQEFRHEFDTEGSSKFQFRTGGFGGCDDSDALTDSSQESRVKNSKCPWNSVDCTSDIYAAVNSNDDGEDSLVLRRARSIHNNRRACFVN